MRKSTQYFSIDVRFDDGQISLLIWNNENSFSTATQESVRIVAKKKIKK